MNGYEYSSNSPNDIRGKIEINGELRDFFLTIYGLTDISESSDLVQAKISYDEYVYEQDSGAVVYYFQTDDKAAQLSLDENGDLDFNIVLENGLEPSGYLEVELVREIHISEDNVRVEENFREESCY